MVSSLGAVHMDGERVPSAAPCTFPWDPGCFPCVLFIALEFPTLVHVNSSTLLVHGVLVLGFD